jgi:DNA-binding response OmpR family regulator
VVDNEHQRAHTVRQYLEMAGYAVTVVEDSPTLHAGDILIDLDRHLATQRGRVLDLTPYELRILAALVRKPGRVLTRQHLLEQLGDLACDQYDRVVDQHIKNIRAKLGDDARRPRYIATVYGSGYKLLDEPMHGS